MPLLPDQAPKKKRKVLQHEKLYLEALPKGTKYSKSLMHRDTIAFVTVTPHTDFLITSSVDGVVKFWKKQSVGIEFVKMFRAHVGEIRGVSVSADGRSFASIGMDKTVKIFDVVTFDLLATIPLSLTPLCVCWVHRKGAPLPLLAISDEVNSTISIYDGRGEQHTPLHTVTNVHRKSVTLMAYNDKYDCVISVDDGGMVEYWRPSGNFDKPPNVFDLKSDTNLFDFKKNKCVPISLTISPTGAAWSTFSHPDRLIRVFDFCTAKLIKTYDESISTLSTRQQSLPASSVHKLEDLDFGRRLAIERDIDSKSPSPVIRTTIAFDETGYFLIYGSLVGIKVINTITHNCLRLYGRDDGFRAINIAIYQGAPKRKEVMTVEMAASSNPLLEEGEERDPIIFATGWSKQRFYMFTNDTSVSKSDRDILNERPLAASGTDAAAAAAAAAKKQEAAAPTACILHTTMGDIHLRLFPEHAPKAVENFTTHARNGYYNGTIFHRVIRKFMIQGGDPLGDGTGGDSIWGREFEDEICDELKHDRPYTLSMANAGRNTNGSQFFITTEKCPWLDGKHTIFGRAVQGLDVVHRIENVRTFKDKPETDIEIVSITVL
ncbi:peptidyl-prolyl cis-trans isomerase cypE [Kalaharituber pfeilii]|nr:peptidyl-prolyl cis-trans isomerase cypE [Kalaharituber pfeilii]